MAAYKIVILCGLLFRRLMETKSWQQGTAEEGGMRRINASMLAGQVSWAPLAEGRKLGQWMEARKGSVTQNCWVKRLTLQNLMYWKWPDWLWPSNLHCSYFHYGSICCLVLWFSEVAVAVTRQITQARSENIPWEALLVVIAFAAANEHFLKFLFWYPGIDVTQWCLTSLYPPWLCH